MRALMGLIKNQHGTYYAQQRIPERLQVAVAKVLELDKPRLVFLKRSLGTKALKEANTRAKPVQMEFDRVLQRAEALLVAKPLRTTLSAIEIQRMGEHHYASLLAEDDLERQGGSGDLNKDDQRAVVRFEMDARTRSEIDTGQALEIASEALSTNDLKAVEHDVRDLLETFAIPLDDQSKAFAKLSLEVLRQQVRAFRDIRRRDEGEPVRTPVVTLPAPLSSPMETGETLKAALAGWKKERERPAGTVHEYERAVGMFIDLHGDLPLVSMKRSHALRFREALRMVPRTRRGALLKASLTVLSQWGTEHPEAPRVSAGTVNKQIGAVQAIAGWGYGHGLIPDDVTWADPFRDMRFEEDQSSRTSFDLKELQTIFDAPLFTDGKVPVGGKGDAAVWLPLLALYAGARQAELAGLRASDIHEEPSTKTPLIVIEANLKAGRRLKNKSSARMVPVHPQLIALGFLDYVTARQHEADGAWLFPTVAPPSKGALSAWAKWWGRYLRGHAGVTDTDKVFHSFRHGFKDAARAAGVSQEVHDALTGHAHTSTVSGGYGAKNMLARFGIKVLKDAVESITFPGLDLSRVRVPGRRSSSSRTNRQTKKG